MLGGVGSLSMLRFLAQDHWDFPMGVKRLQQDIGGCVLSLSGEARLASGCDLRTNA